MIELKSTLNLILKLLLTLLFSIGVSSCGRGSAPGINADLNATNDTQLQSAVLSSTSSSLQYSTSSSGAIVLTCPDGQPPLLDAVDPCPTSPSPSPSQSPSPGGGNSATNVECELGAPNVKINLLEQNLSGGSNASKSRICMSEHPV